MKRLIVALLLCLLILSGCSAEQSVAFTVNDIEVERKELLFYMRRLLDETVADIETEYNISAADDDFWNTPVGDSTPLEILKSAASEKIVRIKSEMLCAKEHGIDVLPFAYSKQIAEWERDNNERQRKADNGETVYGTVLRSFYTFFQDNFLSMQNELQLVLEKEGILKVTEKEAEEYYNKYKSVLNASFEESENTVYGWLLNEKYEKYIDTLSSSAEVVYKNMDIDSSELD